MELSKITNDIWYIPNVVNIGVVRYDDDSAILIDTGIDRNIGKRIVKLLDKEKLKIKAILNTHSHADHCGGNKYIKQTTGANIYAPDIESTIIQTPYLEPWYLYSGAAPLGDLQNKFLMADPSVVDFTIASNQDVIKFDEIEFKIISLPGHSLNQVGFVIDSVFFCADILFAESILTKYRVPYLTDLDQTIETLNFVKETQYDFYVPSHANPSEELTKLININLNTLTEIEELLLSNLQKQKTIEQLIADILDHYQNTITRVSEYFLLKTPIMAILSSLHKKGVVKYNFQSNYLYWEKIKN